MKKREEDLRKKSKKIRVVIILVLIFLALLILIFSSKSPGWINSLLGKDISIKLETNQQDFSIKHQEKENVSFKISLQGNPLCKARCNYRFWDISRNETIKEENFTLNLISKIFDFELEPKRLGKGQELYRFDLKCKGIYSASCHTAEKEDIRNILVSLQYTLNDEEKFLKETSLERLNLMLINLNLWHSKLIYFNESLIELNKSSSVDNLFDKKIYFEENISYLDQKIKNLRNLWKKQDYFVLNESLNSEETFFKDFGEDIISFNQNFEENLSMYNLLIERLNLTRSMLHEMKEALILNETNFSRSSEVNPTILEFNFKLKTIESKNLIKQKNKLSINIFNKTFELYLDFKNQAQGDIILGENSLEEEYSNISEINLTQIKFDKRDYNMEISFDEPNETCCVFNKCQDCYLEGSCLDQEENFPIVFVHGHDFSKYSSAEYTLYTQNKIQDKLEQKGFLNAGAISMNSDRENMGIWGKANVPVTIKLSYYFDLKNRSGEYVLTQTKNENITEYAKRLNNLIEIVKYKTGKKKVVIIAHSMGGLVSRRYIQIYGQESVSKLILVAVPNQGIAEEISNFCPVLGENKECVDMQVNSVFMKELGKADNLTIPNYAIIGTGCMMLNGKGDGMVLEKNAKLPGAKTFIIRGNCVGGFLHTKMNDPKLYPMTYGLIEEILKDEV